MRLLSSTYGFQGEQAAHLHQRLTSLRRPAPAPPPSRPLHASQREAPQYRRMRAWDHEQELEAYLRQQREYERREAAYFFEQPGDRLFNRTWS